MKRIASLVAACVLIGSSGRVIAGDGPDLAKIERKIGKEPGYWSGRPLYGLYVFGPKAGTRIWTVLDRSWVSRGEYDILYIDRNGDGDLTGPGERIGGKVEGKGEERSVTFEVGEIRGPTTEAVATKVRFFNFGEGSVGAFLNVRGDHFFSTGFAEAFQAGTPPGQFATKPADAPIFWPGIESPLHFQRRYWRGMDPILRIGAGNEFHVFLGHRGVGRATFCAMGESELPAKVPVLATLIYTDAGGKEKRSSDELRERC